MSELSSADKAIREAIRRTMQEKGLTQAALAKQLGVKQPSVADLISGRRGRQPESLMDLLDVLGLELTVKPKATASTTPEAPAYLSLAGMIDDPDSPGDVSAKHDDAVSEALAAEFLGDLKNER